MSSTLLQLRTRVRTELDLLDEPAVTDTELTTKINEGIDVVEAKILDLYEDYFLKRGTAISLVAGTQDYAYPTDIWANKIRALVYRNGSVITEVPRVSGVNQMGSFEDMERNDALATWSPTTMRYLPLNDVIRLTPAPSSSQASVLVPWYIRQALRLSADADICDIPEWEGVVVAYAKNEIALDKAGLADPTKTSMKLDALMNLMEASLSNRVPDEWNFVAMDNSIYEEHS
jgi:hypothetical protein